MPEGTLRLPADIKKIIHDDSNEDLLDWSILLFFFKNNKHNLTLTQKRKIYKRSEAFRIFQNTPRTKDVKINKNGKWMDAIVEVPTLDIEIEDISPSDLYQDKTITDMNTFENLIDRLTSIFSFKVLRFQTLNIFNFF